MDKETLIATLKSEIERATGCTEVSGTAFVAARAAQELGAEPERIEITVSPLFYRNGVSVGVPGTGLSGFPIAAILGALVGRADAGLAVLDYSDEATIAKARRLFDKIPVKVDYQQAIDPLYLKVKLFHDGRSASAAVAHDYMHLVEVCRDDEVIFRSPVGEDEPVEEAFLAYSVEEIINLILTMDTADLAFLIDYAKVNCEAAQIGLNNPASTFGPALQRMQGNLPEPYSIMSKVQLLTAAAGEARMRGLQAPVMAIAGSGNHGITNFLGMLTVAQALNANDEQLAKSLAITSAITVYIKSHVSRMTAFCGCSVAPATGIAAGTVYLLGGGYQDMVNAMHSVIGTFSGMLCDGAKLSCAFRLSTVASLAVQFAYLALDGAYVQPGTGVVGHTIEATVHNLERLNNPGMLKTSDVVIELIESSQNTAK